MQAIKIADGSTSLWQWDTGVRIKVYGCTDVDQMHFVTPGGIISRELVDGECGVPDTALQTEGLLKMYAFDRTETGGVTRCDFLLMVKARPKPADYIDPPDEYDNLQALAERVAPLIPGGGGSVTPEQIGAAVEEYLAENPVQIEETDPTVPGWAKAEKKPTYTAEEVGALPANAEIVDQTARDGVATLSEEIVTHSTVLTASQKESCQRFAALFKDVSFNVDSFLFFTDPHLADALSVSQNFDTQLNKIAAVYNSTPTSSCVCGGDWLNWGNTKDNACWILGKIDGAMKVRFDDYVLVVGNHDTNYLGKEYVDSGWNSDAHTQCILTDNAVHALWHREHAHKYFRKKIDSGMYYVFDTGLDWFSEMDEYRWGQVDWFANSLLEDESERSAAIMHITEDSEQTSTPFVDAITTIAKCYNDRSATTLNGTTYDFSSATGRFYFIIGGHKHSDSNYIVNSIPVIITTNLGANETEPTFDLVMVDYDSGKLYTVRVGTGEDRSIPLITESVNIFEIGESYNDYEAAAFEWNNNVDALVVDAENGTLVAPSLAAGQRLIMGKKAYVNSTGTYNFKATFSNEVDLPQSYTAAVRIFDANGEKVTNWEGGWPYNETLEMFIYKVETGLVGSVSRCDETFTLPDNAATFKLIFQFTTPIGGVAGTNVTISNISLTAIED